MISEHNTVVFRDRRVIVCGAFPPPVNGLANVNLAVLKLLLALGAHVDQVDISAKGGAIVKLGRRFAALARTLRLIVRPGPERLLYYALSSGLGQYFDLLAIAVARFAGVRVVIHHHNFSYLSASTPVSRCLFALASRGYAVHICLCETMAGLLLKTYGAGHEVVIIGNAAFIEPDIQAMSGVKPALPDKIKVGYLSALTRDKGIYDFLDIVETFAAEKAVSVEFHVAGNAAEAAVQTRLESLAARGIVSFRGAVYDESKRDYLRELDILIFPSRYRHEAQPLVVFEALAAGVSVISHPIACMCDLASSTGVSLAAEGQIMPALRDALQLLPAQRETLTSDILSSYRQLHDRQRDDLRSTFLALFL
ncbi:MAG: glycosyltransferase family 4 protein [Pseudomonadota bacterium]